MAYYKDTNNQLHFLDSTEFEYLLPIDCVVITDEEADDIKQLELAKLSASTINTNQFLLDIKSVVGGIVAYNTLIASYPLLDQSIKGEEWLDVQYLLDDAKTKDIITPINFK